MIKIERNTKPFCLIKEKTMDWEKNMMNILQCLISY